MGGRAGETRGRQGWSRLSLHPPSPSQVADILVACTYLAVKMQPWAAIIVFVTVASYVPLTVSHREGQAGGRSATDTGQSLLLC